MKFYVISIFPDFVRGVFDYGVVRRAIDAGLLEFELVDPRDFTEDRHRTTDDAPYGGGPGMVMLAEPLYRAITDIRQRAGCEVPLIYLTPAGEVLTQQLAQDLSANVFDGKGLSEAREDRADAQRSTLPQSASLILLCGRYEGIDQRLLDLFHAREISIGDFVLSGGELAAMVLIDAVARLLPGVLGNQASVETESFTARSAGGRLLDWPHYTRPEEWRGVRVPEVLLSGNHAKIISFREQAALLLTFQRRPDLLTTEQQEQARRLLGQAG
jgi:tRNA (guanine37-N1)-methyltransferase